MAGDNDEGEFLNMDSPLDRSSSPNMRTFTFLVGTFEFLGLLSIVLASIWLGHFRGGFSWTEDQPVLEFNYHPLMMILGFVFIHGNANLAYRLLRNERKIRLKVIHGGMQLLALVFMIVGLKAVFNSHDHFRNAQGQVEPIPHMYSLHSWVGLSAVLLYSCQWLTGFLFFLFPKFSLSLRRSYLPIHVFFGVVIHILFICAALMGLTEKALFSFKDEYVDKGSEGTLVNLLGIILVLFGLNGVYILVNPNFKRQPRPDDDGAYIPRD